MKIHTPQILWHNGTQNDNGKNAPLLSISLLSTPILTESIHILATSGNTSEVHLWKLNLSEDIFSPLNEKGIQQTKEVDFVKHLIAFERHERSVNAVEFSPDGLTLASAGDAGVIILWTVPVQKRGKGNGRYFWGDITKESDLVCKVVNASCEDIMDISWSPDSKRFALGSLDHSVMVFEAVAEGDWSCVWKNGRDHLSYVQGVSWDPLGNYLASMGSDRVCRVWGRKFSKKKEKKVLVERNEMKDDASEVLKNAKFDVNGKSKGLKYREVTCGDTVKKFHLFAEESTVESFFRRLAWTTDGAYLVTPTALWGLGDESKTSFATYIWGRHQFDRPMAVLKGLDKPSVVVRPCPALFTTPKRPMDSTKENKTSLPPYRSVFAVLTLDTILIYDTHDVGTPLAVARGLHYAGLTDCVWTRDGRNLLVCSSDGYISILRFAEGELGEVYVPKTRMKRVESCPVSEEKVLLPPCPPGQTATIVAPPRKKAKRTIVPTLVSKIDVSKEKRRIVPMVVSGQECTNATGNKSNTSVEETDVVVGAVVDLTLDNRVKKKKRIQPTLLSPLS